MVGGLDGSGVDVAVLDTGIDATHPDVAGRIVASESFVPGETVVDVNGHGTHVASTIAGSGAASEGAARGVAPGAELVIGKVLDGSGNGQESWIIDAMEHQVHGRDTKHRRVEVETMEHVTAYMVAMRLQKVASIGLVGFTGFRIDLFKDAFGRCVGF